MFAHAEIPLAFAARPGVGLLLVLVIGSILVFRRGRSRGCGGRFLRRAVLSTVLLAATLTALFVGTFPVHRDAADSTSQEVVYSSTRNKVLEMLHNRIARLPRHTGPFGDASIEKSNTQGPVEKLPRRAGEIPVTAELAQAEAGTPAAIAPKDDVPPATPPPTATDAQPSAPRPDWLGTPGKLVGSIYRTTVKSGLYVDVPECQRALDEATKHAADQYIEDYLGAGASSLVRHPAHHPCPGPRDKGPEFAEVKQSSTVGPMHQIHALLEFDDDARADFHERWREAIVSERLWYAGAGAALVLGVLATLYGYLKMGLPAGESRGGRVQLAAGVVAMIVAAGALVSVLNRAVLSVSW